MNIHDITKALIWQIGKAVFAIFITISVSWLGIQLETIQKIFLPIGLFVMFSVIETLWVIRKVDKRLIMHHDIWAHLSEFDLLLGSIRANYLSLKDSSSGEKDLFIRHFNNSVRKLNEELNDAANNGRLITNAGYFLSIEHTLNAYTRSTEKIWRFTWYVDDPAELFSISEWVAWFRHCVELLQQKKMAGIKTIFIIENESIASHPHLERLIEFYNSVNNLECNMTTRSKFSTACRAVNIDEIKAIDMGLYGDGLLYLNHSYEPEVMGTFYRDKVTIAKHKSLFDTIWLSKDFSKNVADKKKKSKLTFDDLLAAITSS